MTVSGFEPDEKLKPELLRDVYGCSASTMREVLFRLSCDGFVDFIDQKGFRTPKICKDKLAEIINFRIMLEQQGVCLSIKNADLEWEAKLTAAHHKLAHIEGHMQKEDDVAQFISIWSEAEWGFHQTLVSMCGSQLLKETHHTIYDRHRQMQMMRSASLGFRDDTITEHKEILDAALARDPENCCRSIEKHLNNSLLPDKNMLAA